MLEDIYWIFKSRDYRWNFSDGSRVPSLEELTDAVDRLKTALLESEDKTQVASGRLIVKKDEGHYDIYVHMGEI